MYVFTYLNPLFPAAISRRNDPQDIYVHMYGMMIPKLKGWLVDDKLIYDRLECLRLKI